MAAATRKKSGRKAFVNKRSGNSLSAEIPSFLISFAIGEFFYASLPQISSKIGAMKTHIYTFLDIMKETSFIATAFLKKIVDSQKKSAILINKI